MIGGMGRSWSVPVYILNGHFPDAFWAEKDPVPFDGEPPPEHGPVVLGPHPIAPDWQGEQQGTGAPANLGFFEGNLHPAPQQPANQILGHVCHHQQHQPGGI